MDMDTRGSQTDVMEGAQAAFPVSYKGQYVRQYVADWLVEEEFLVELKCVERFGIALPPGPSRYFVDTI